MSGTRTPLSFLAIAAVLASAVAAACGSQGSRGASLDTPDSGAPGGQGGSSGVSLGGASWALVDAGNDSGGASGVEQILSSFRIEPLETTVSITPAAPATVTFQAFGTLAGTSGELNLTDRTVFYVSDGYLVGSFPGNGATFETNTDDPRGGKVTVTALAANSDGTVASATATITVKLRASLKGDGALPSGAGTLFSGPAKSGFAPRIVYPNDGVLLPPNLQTLDVHWRRNGASTTLFQLIFNGPTIALQYLTRCTTVIRGGCAFTLDSTGFHYLAESSRGGEPVHLTVRATDDAGSGVGTSKSFRIQFSSTDLRGALYYWSAKDGSIRRVDFGSVDQKPEKFLAGGQDGLENTCLGCHAISRDGKKMVASFGGQYDGRLIFIKDMSKPKTSASFFTKKGDPNSRIQFASFSPDGARFVAVDADTGDVTLQRTLWFHDGNTGDRIPSESIVLPFEPDHPAWSPDGTMIAMTRVGVHNTSQRPGHMGLELIREQADGWGAPETLIPWDSPHARYNPSFLPDSSALVFSESTCGARADSCDGDSDPSAKTWAMKPVAGAKPLRLINAGSGGVEDGNAVNLSDTFPRVAPFESEWNGNRIYWVTISSKRHEGLRAPGNFQIWMFAMDPAKIGRGEDGSFPAFYLPFQDMTTSNHIGQWTEQIVSADPPPPIPAPPPPPEPPVPPPPPGPK